MSDIVLSIHPKYAELILEGKKTIEVRKTVPNKFRFTPPPEGHRIFLYATAPIQKVVGVVEYDGHWITGIACAPHSVPEHIMPNTCLTIEELRAYLGDEAGHLWYLINPVRFEVPVPLQDFGIARPPQSFCYVPELDEISHTVCWVCSGSGKFYGHDCFKCEGRGSVCIRGVSHEN